MNPHVALQIPRLPKPRRFSGACTVEVKDLQVMADIGVYAHEMLERQPLDLDIEIQLRGVPLEDALERTLDYSHVVALANEISTRRIALIETFARTLAEQLLDHSLVQSVCIHVRKPHALKGCLAGCRVELARE